MAAWQSAAIGLIIDDAIVMVEQIIRRVRGNVGGPTAAEGAGRAGSTVLRAAAEFTRPLVGSSAATIVIFLPLAMLSGVTGAFFKALSLTMAANLVFSFVIAWLAVPLAAEWLLGPRETEREDSGGLTGWFNERYASLATWIVRRPGRVVVAFTLLWSPSAISRSTRSEPDSCR